jgi:hypothetical protein
MGAGGSKVAAEVGVLGVRLKRQSGANARGGQQRNLYFLHRGSPLGGVVFFVFLTTAVSP